MALLAASRVCSLETSREKSHCFCSLRTRDILFLNVYPLHVPGGHPMGHLSCLSVSAVKHVLLLLRMLFDLKKKTYGDQSVLVFVRVFSSLCSCQRLEGDVELEVNYQPHFNTITKTGEANFSKVPHAVAELIDNSIQVRLGPISPRQGSREEGGRKPWGRERVAALCLFSLIFGDRVVGPVPDECVSGALGSTLSEERLFRETDTYTGAVWPWTQEAWLYNYHRPSRRSREPTQTWGTSEPVSVVAAWACVMFAGVRNTMQHNLYPSVLLPLLFLVLNIHHPLHPLPSPVFFTGN